MADITLCTSKTCPSIKKCLRSKYNGYFLINEEYQSYSDFSDYLLASKDRKECEMIIRDDDKFI